MISSKFKLSGLSCSACEKLVTKRITGIPGVTNVQVSAASQTAEILAEREVELTEVALALKDTNYQAISKES